MNEPTQHEATEFIIGTEVLGSDGALGELKRVVIDPITQAITHLDVEPPHRPGAGHLVPVSVVSSASAESITLSCTATEFATLDEAEDIHFLPGAPGAWGYQPSQMLTQPYFPLGGMGMGMSGGPQAVITDRVPAGEVEVRRGDRVHATDGDIGRVQGLIVDPSDYAVTHVLLDEGHLWGKKRVAVPIRTVTRADEGIQVSLSKQEIGDLPPVSLES